MPKRKLEDEFEEDEGVGETRTGLTTKMQRMDAVLRAFEEELEGFFDANGILSIKEVAKAKKDRIGRPTVMTREVLALLRNAWLLGANDTEACRAASIGRQTLTDFMKDFPEFKELREKWKDANVLRARMNLSRVLNDPNDPNNYSASVFYLKSKRKDEFSERSELVGKDGEPLVDFSKAFKDRMAKYAPQPTASPDPEGSAGELPAGGEVRRLEGGS